MKIVLKIVALFTENYPSQNLWIVQNFNKIIQKTRCSRLLPDDWALIVTVPSNKRNNVLWNILKNLSVGCLGQRPTKSKLTKKIKFLNFSLSLISRIAKSVEYVLKYPVKRPVPIFKKVISLLRTRFLNHFRIAETVLILVFVDNTNHSHFQMKL